MDPEVKNLQTKIALCRTKCPINIQKNLKTKAKLEVKKISQIEFDEVKDFAVKIPKLEVLPLSVSATVDYQKVEELKRFSEQQQMMLRIINRMKKSEISRLVYEL